MHARRGGRQAVDEEADAPEEHECDADPWLRRDIRTAEQTIREATGADPRPLFRCPYGSGAEDERVLSAIEELGYRHIGWDVDPRDWEEGRGVDELVELVLARVVDFGDGATVLLHSWPTVTAESIGRVLDDLRAVGAEFVPCWSEATPAG